MARKPTIAVADEVVEPLSTGNPADKATALSAQAQRSMEIAERFGEGVPYQRERVISEARFFMVASTEAMLELGKRVIQIKENEPHGNFMEALARIGIGYRTAHRVMVATAKFIDPNRKPLLTLSKAKLFDLMVESDDDLDALAKGGTFAGLKLQEIDRMSSREFKEVVRNFKQREDAKDALLAKKDKKINELTEQLELRRRMTGDELATAQTEELRSVKSSVFAALNQLVVCADEIARRPATSVVELEARQALDAAAQHFSHLATQRGFALNFDDQVQKAKMQEIRQLITTAGKPGKRASGAD